MDQLQYYYTKAANTAWIKYIFYIAITIVILILTYQLIPIATTKDYQSFSVKDAGKCITTDKKHCYIIGKKFIAKYNKKGKKISKKSLLKNMSSGALVNGDLVIVNNTKTGPVAVWVDPDTLEVIDDIEIPQIDGPVSWIGWGWNKWWICQGKNAKNASIFCFNPDWVMEGYWKLPKKMVKEIKPSTITGGVWHGEYLCVISDNQVLYVIDFPLDKVHAKLIRKLSVPFKCGLALEPHKKGMISWGTSDNSIIKHKIDL